MNQDQIQDAIEDVKTWIGRSPASIDERYYERKAGEAFDSLVEEIERLKCESQKNFMAFTQEAMKSGVKTELRDQETQSLRSQIATLTAERDEARRDVEKWVATVGNASRLVDSLTAELAALKSCPAMAEIDAAKRCVLGETRNPCHSWALLEEYLDKLADLARRSIASREEVVGLLKWLDEFYDFREAKKCLCEYASDKVYGDDQQKARRILEIVEGK